MRGAFTRRPWVRDCVPRETDESHSESHVRRPTVDPELTSRTLANVARLDLRAIRDAIFQRSFPTAFLADSSAGSPLQLQTTFFKSEICVGGGFHPGARDRCQCHRFQLDR